MTETTVDPNEDPIQDLRATVGESGTIVLSWRRRTNVMLSHGVIQYRRKGTSLWLRNYGVGGILTGDEMRLYGFEDAADQDIKLEVGTPGGWTYSYETEVMMP